MYYGPHSAMRYNFKKHIQKCRLVNRIRIKNFVSFNYQPAVVGIIATVITRKIAFMASGDFLPDAYKQRISRAIDSDIFNFLGMSAGFAFFHQFPL